MSYRTPIARRGSTRAGRGGYAALIGLLVVLLILMIVLLLGPLRGGPATATRQVKLQYAIHPNRPDEAACAGNRIAISASLVPWLQDHPEQAVTPALIAAMSAGHVCPRGGVYYVSKDGITIYCSAHDPPPEKLRKDLVEFAPPTPTPTPAG